ncbi:MAG TPA: hypothetical protein VIM53_04275 [Candidatus Saccharimonadales bacterium]
MNQINNLMQKEMTRKEFLTTLGFGVASVLGFSSVLKMLFGKGEQHFQASNMGYGSSVYGGVSEHHK